MYNTFVNVLKTFSRSSLIGKVVTCGYAYELSTVITCLGVENKIVWVITRISNFNTYDLLKILL